MKKIRVRNPKTKILRVRVSELIYKKFEKAEKVTGHNKSELARRFFREGLINVLQ